MTPRRTLVQYATYARRWTKGGILGRRFAYDVASLTTANFITAVFGIVQGILVARWLGPEEYGVAALVMSYPGFLFSFFDVRSVEASVKYMSAFHVKNDKDRALGVFMLGQSVDFLVRFIVLILVIVTADWASRLLVHKSTVALLMIIYGTAFIPRALVGTSFASLSVFGEFALIAKIEILSQFLSSALILGLVSMNLGVDGIIWGNVVAMTFSGLAYGVTAYRVVRREWGNVHWRSSWMSLIGRRREILKFMFYTDLNMLFDLIPKQLDLLLLGYMRSPSEVGYYKIAKSLAGVLSNLTRPLQSVTYPRIARLWEARFEEELRQLLYKLAFGLGGLLALMVISGLLLLPWLVPIALGESYAPAVLATQLLVAVTGLRLIYFWVKPFYLSTDRIRLLTLFSLVGVITVIPVYTISISIWGINGLAMSRLAIAIATEGVAGFVAITMIFRTRRSVVL